MTIKKPLTFLLWANDRMMWWKAMGCGYTADINEAGRFSQSDALVEVLNSAFAGRLDQATVMIAAPENWIQHP